MFLPVPVHPGSPEQNPVSHKMVVVVVVPECYDTVLQLIG